MPLTQRHLSRDSGGFRDGIDQGRFGMKRLAKFYQTSFATCPAVAPQSSTPGYGTPLGSTGGVNMATFERGVRLEWHVKGTQSILLPTWSSTLGWDIAQDQTATDGIELSAGIAAPSPGSFVIGTDRDFYVQVTIKMVDASGTDNFYFGWRLNQGYQTALASYTDYSAIGFNASAATQAVKILTKLNSAGAAALDTGKTWADNETHTLKVRISQQGYARFYFDGAEPSVTRTDFKHDAGDSVNWFLFMLQGTDVADNIYLQGLEWGYVPKNAE